MKENNKSTGSRAKVDIPSSWNILPLEDVAKHEAYSFVDGPFGSNLKTSDYTAEGIRLIQLQNIGEGYWIDDNKKYTSENKFKELIRHAAFPGDIVIAKMPDPIARACIVPIVSNRYLVVADCIKLSHDISICNSNYLVNAINHQSFRNQVLRIASGTTRLRVNLGQLKKILVSIPPLIEQEHIAEVIHIVDDVIYYTEQVIVKLQKIHQGLLHDLLTRGLDESGHIRNPEKEPGVFRNLHANNSINPRNLIKTNYKHIPKGWKSVQLDDTCYLITDGSHYSPKPIERGRIIANVKDMKNGFIDIDSCKRISDGDFLSLVNNNCSPKAGDVLFSKDGTIGEVVVYYQPHEIVLLSSIAILRPNGNLLPRYLGYFMQSTLFRKQLNSYKSGSALRRIVLRDISKLLVYIPPLREQEEIINILDTMSKRIQKEKKLLEKVNYIKKGLMDDLLTGKVRVKISEKTQ
jgi:type I restriction enzyme S subunit